MYRPERVCLYPPQGVIKINYRSVQKVSYKCTQNTFNSLQTVS